VLKKQINILKNNKEEYESNVQCKLSSVRTENTDNKQALANCKKDLQSSHSEIDSLHTDYQERLNSMENE